jgi:hypothetical protein
MEAFAVSGKASCDQRQGEGRALCLYQRRRPAQTVFYQIVQEHSKTFLALADDPTGPVLRFNAP